MFIKALDFRKVCNSVCWSSC